MPLYKFIKEFFIPPGLYISIFLLISGYLSLVLFFINKQTAKDKSCKMIKCMLSLGICFCLTCGLATYGLTTKIGSDRFIHSLEYKYNNKAIKPDAIILLGESPYRTRAAIKLYKKYKVAVIPSGYHGSAERMAKALVTNGVPASAIIEERQASNTKEHVKYILPIAKGKGYNRVYLVTSAYHMPRSMMNFERTFAEHGIEVVPYCCDYYTSRVFKSTNRDWMPDIRYFQQSAIAWNEYLGMLELWLF